MKFPFFLPRLSVRQVKNNDSDEIDLIGRIMGDVFADFGLISDKFSIFLFPFAGGRYQLPIMPSRSALLVSGWLKVPIRTDLLPDGVFINHLLDERLLTALRSALGRNVEVYQVPKTPLASIWTETADVHPREYEVWYFVEMKRESLRSIPRFVPFDVLSRPDGSNLVLPIGMSVGGRLTYLDWSTEVTGLLLGGATNTGKSVFLRQCFAFYDKFYSIDDLRIWVADFKHGLEFSRLPKSRFVVFTDNERDCVEKFLYEVSAEMDFRFNLLSQSNCVDILEYRQRVNKLLPFILIFIDEFAPFKYLGGKDSLEEVSLKAAQSRALGMYWCISTQRPDVSIVIGSLKANLGTRISFSQATRIDYGVICGDNVLPEYVKGSLGCPGRGWCVCGDKLFEFQSPFISPDYFSSADVKSS